MARHLDTAEKLGAPVYFCDFGSPWQRGTNENTNGLLRGYFPKGFTLITIHRSICWPLKTNSTTVFAWSSNRCPADLFAALLVSTGPSVWQR